MSSSKRSSRRRGGSGRTRRRKKTLHEKWIKRLIAMGAYRQEASDNQHQMVLLYQTTIPPRMPSPGGPSKGASMTMTQLVRGSDMTLPTGSAIVGALIRQSGSTDIFASFAFALADIPNVASVGALYDQYRLEEIQFRLRSRNNAISVYNTASPNNAAVAPLIVVDRDDNTAPTTLLELQQYDNCQEMSPMDSIDIVFEPSVTPSIYSGGAFSGYGVQGSKKLWLDVANTTIPHYGLKLGIPALPATTTNRFDWDVEAWYKVSFLNVR